MNRRRFLQATAVSAAVPALSATPALDSVEIARRHRITGEIPTPNFFEGMLLGNGDVGVCVTLRPDALGLHIGKEDAWDIRVSEDHYQHVLPFDQLLKLWERAGDEAKRQGKPDMTYLETKIDFLREYTEKVSSSYRKPWPRPWPCGIVWIHWDSRKVRLVRQTLDPSDGLFSAELVYDDLRGSQRPFQMFALVSRAANHVCVWSEGPAPIESVVYLPNLDPDAKLPAPEVSASDGSFACYQIFPATAPTDAIPDPPPTAGDSSFAIAGRYRLAEFRLDLTIATPADAKQNRQFVAAEVERMAARPVGEVHQESAKGWREFWAKSAVEFEDRELERIWYHNQYFLACCLREGKLAPGLFGNWSSGRIGTAWHGDYHMNYNTQQVFWGVFSSNHVEQHLPYVDLCEKLTVVGESYAREKFGMPGAFYFHSAYPVPSKVNPYPAPPWGYEVCETPWTVQSLWWHYLYTQDRDYLKRVYPMLKAASVFLTPT